MRVSHCTSADLSTCIETFVLVTWPSLELAIIGGICVSQTHLVFSFHVISILFCLRSEIWKVRRSYNHSLCNAKFTNQAPVQSMVTTKVFERLQIDLVDMRKESCNGVEYSYILSIMDCFLRFIFLRPLSNKIPRSVLKCLQNIVSLYCTMRQWNRI